MEQLRERSGTAGWIGLAAFVIAADVVLPETLSAASDRFLENKRSRAVWWAVGGYVFAHVYNILPPKLDLIQRTADWALDK